MGTISMQVLCNVDEVCTDVEKVEDLCVSVMYVCVLTSRKYV